LLGPSSVKRRKKKTVLGKDIEQRVTAGLVEEMVLSV
jgi:hypothetical protein